MKKSIYLILFLICFGAYAQQKQGKEVAKPHLILQATSFNEVEALSKRENLILRNVEERIIKNDRWHNYPTNFEALPKGKDPLLEYNNSITQARYSLLPPVVSFDGSNRALHSNATPPDPTGAAGPNHYIHAYNTGFVIFNKDGSVALPHASLSNLFPGNEDGDPIILFDRYAAGGEGRFVITQFNQSNNSLLLAICQGPDPVNDGWFTYEFSTGEFPDYPKYGVWHDGYYVTANINGNNSFFVLERDKMLAGDDTATIQGFTLPGLTTSTTTVFSASPVNSVGPTLPDSSTPGYVIYIQDDAWTSEADRLKIWDVDIDWTDPNNSTVTEGSELLTAPFDTFVADFGSGEVPQPNTNQKIDGITGVMSMATNYYQFGSHGSLTVNFNVDVNGDDTLLGIRWYELRQTSGNWSIHQESTYAPDDGLYRFMGSMAMDSEGNIGLAFSAGNATNPVSLRYTGRFAGSPLNQMTVNEEVIIEGTGYQNTGNRYGDYAHMTLDPVDNQTFWFTSEYFTGVDDWTNRIAAFKIAPTDPIDVGVVNISSPNDGLLTNNEQITIEILNFGTEAQSNIPVSYQIDGGTVINEVFTGTINSTETATYTFTATADLSSVGASYNITASTALTNDANTSNDPFSKIVKHLYPNDVGVANIIDPTTGENLTSTESVQVEIRNFGGLPQSNFDVSYSINGGTAVTETITSTINVGESLNYTFAATADLGTIGAYEIIASTLLDTDQDTSNDSFTKEVNNQSCIPETVLGCNNTGIKKFILGTIDADDGGAGCNSTGDVQGYSDRTDMSTDLDLGISDTHIVQMRHNFTPDPSSVVVSAWIDSNDNGVFETEEQLIMGESFTVANALEDFDLVLPADINLGSHIIRFRLLTTQAPILTDINDPCAGIGAGETQDYTVNIINTVLSVDEFGLGDAEFDIYTLGNNQFDVVLKSNTFNEELVVSMYDVTGKRLVRNRVSKQGNMYTHRLNLNGISTGVYLVRMGNDTFGRVKRIIVN